jgi:hypothetical protein
MPVADHNARQQLNCVAHAIWTAHDSERQKSVSGISAQAGVLCLQMISLPEHV